MVKWFFGFGSERLSKTALTIAGVNSFELRPYRPPTMTGSEGIGSQSAVRASRMAATMSRYNGSPIAPASFVRSSTLIDFTVEGRVFANASTENGR